MGYRIRERYKHSRIQRRRTNIEDSIVGRPKKHINKSQFHKLCKLQCTEEEIADFFNLNVTTLQKLCYEIYGVGFSEIYRKYSDKGKISLRRSQWKLSETSVPMAIWLGKQHLNQKDIPVIDQSKHTHFVITTTENLQIKSKFNELMNKENQTEEESVKLLPEKTDADDTEIKIENEEVVNQEIKTENEKIVNQL
jgi:AraC-like DNA-binding protein